MAESMLGEPSDVSRVMFPPDYNTAAVVTRGVYQTRGQFWTLLVPKSESVPDLFTGEEAELLLHRGALRLDWAGHDMAHQRLVLTAIGSYQLAETLKASNRLAERRVPHSVVYMLEPGRFREPRSEGEAVHAAPDQLCQKLYPPHVAARIFVVHTRPEPMLGILQPLNTGHGQTRALGLLGKGGTLTSSGMLFVNGCTWAHILGKAAHMLGLPSEDLLSSDELHAINGKASPQGIVI